MPRINLPPVTRAVLLLLIAASSLNAVIRTTKWRQSLDSTSSAANYLSSPRWAVPYLVCVPTTSLRYPWTVLTAALVENNVVSLVISSAVVFFGGRYLERAWGTHDFAKFIIVVTLIPNVITFILYAIWHAFVTAPEYPTPLNGQVALAAGFLVALKQLVPEHTVSLFKGVISMRLKHAPAVFVLANMISGPVLGTDTAFWLSLLGFWISWIWLRFLRVSTLSTVATGGTDTIIIGDASDTFSFAAFFPDVLHPVLSPICDGIYHILVQLRLCTPFSEEAIEAGNENAASRADGVLPSFNDSRAGSSRRAEAERRRAIALKALDQRLNAAAANRSAPTAVTTVQASLGQPKAESADSANAAAPEGSGNSPLGETNS
ncbi:hypothetical protein CKM354_000298800 [Cercospora kikuchii]|uniref:DUF1751-domain-containing protein n=1 Tax=Cercospora kikuchii TaxID=84275 RepID=A0A9P3C8N4_9PEZI|nr:uncharacterized protein CKM354_000298800 [Cercospora kikuchii]GIZ39609.1 hypothetical protein CKM354_000298800 [Cercospora kikuchii]